MLTCKRNSCIKLRKKLADPSGVEREKENSPTTICEAEVLVVPSVNITPSEASRRPEHGHGLSAVWTPPADGVRDMVAL